jgi:hypothetical protein
MKTRTTLHCSPLALLLTNLLGVAGSVVAAMPQQSPEPSAPVASVPADAPLAQSRRDMLHLAYQAASAFPVQPHAKSRSLAQEKVVLACLELDQPQLALKFCQTIVDWRRGSCLADYAQYCATHDCRAEAERCLQLAEQIAHDVKNDANPQEWRRDTILLKVARTEARLGKRSDAEKVAADVDPTTGLAFDASLADVSSARADLITADNLDRELAAMDDLLVNEASGLTFSALVTCAKLFARFYDDEDRRSAIEKRIRIENAKLPPNFRMVTLLEVARVSLDHHDPKKAMESLRAAQDFFERIEWTKDVQVAFTAQLAALLGKAGSMDEANAKLEAGLVDYQEARDTFRGTKLAEILRPFAEAWHALGNAERANDLYTMVVEEGMENPNSRPRAEAISATCISMAKNSFTPDKQLLTRIREIVNGLGDPW